MRKWSFFICTFGCKVNQYESQSVREAWTALGGVESPSPEGADVTLINSCAVTGKAERDARNAIFGLERKAPHALRLITGCSARLAGERFSGGKTLHAIIPNSHKADLLGDPFALAQPPPAEEPDLSRPAPAEAHDSARAMPNCADRADRNGGSDAASAPYPPFSISGFQRSRPILKVQDGCSRRCTYCIVPLMRGPGVSRAPEDALGEAQRLFAAGFRELIISGINLAQYGRDLPAAKFRRTDSANESTPGNTPGKGASRYTDFWDLAEMLEANLAPEWAGRARLRISSLDPNQLDEKAVRILSSGRMFSPHLHLSLQSGSPDILRRMGRGDQRLPAMLDALADLRRHWPVMGLGADILTGFPGESEADVEATAKIMRACNLHYAHVFPFAARPGTPAASFAGQVPLREKMRRAATLRELAAAQGRTFVESLLGRELNVIADGNSGKKAVNEFYAPCEFAAPPAVADNRSMIRARASAIKNNILIIEKI